MESMSTLRRPRGYVVVAALLALTWAIGCGSRRTAPVSGRVTINGQPVEGIIVYFSPVAGSDPMNAGVPSRGRTTAEGHFTLSTMDVKKDYPGALVGTHTVTMDDERTFEKLNTKSRVLTGWQTTFEVTTQGSDKADFEISKKRP